MDARATARSLSDGRAAVGAACFAAPGLTTRVWIGDDAVDLTLTLLDGLPRGAAVLVGALAGSGAARAAAPER